MWSGSGDLWDAVALEVEGGVFWVRCSCVSGRCIPIGDFSVCCTLHLVGGLLLGFPKRSYTFALVVPCVESFLGKAWLRFCGCRCDKFSFVSWVDVVLRWGLDCVAFFSSEVLPQKEKELLVWHTMFFLSC